MARRNDHSREQLRSMSLEAAERILDSEGVQALSVRRIAQSIGYTHGTLYLLFQNLDDLFQVPCFRGTHAAPCTEITSSASTRLSPQRLINTSAPAPARAS